MRWSTLCIKLSIPVAICSAFKTTSPARLFQALQQQAGKLIISDIVSPWIQQRGYPVVHVQRNPTNTTYRQELFNLKGPNSADSTIVWPIPINSASSANINGFQQTASPLLFKEKSLLVSVPERAAWEVLNVQQTGESDCEWIIGGSLKPRISKK